MALWDRMHTGHKLSALLHGGLIMWVALFGFLSAPSRDRSPPVTEVALISASEFAAISTPRAAPAEPAPAAPAPRPEPAPAPEAEPEPEPEAAAPITAPPPPAPPAETGEETPPQAAVRAPELTPDASLRPVQRPAERVAPEPVPAPAPDAQIDRREQAVLIPDPEAAPSEAPPAQEQTAPEAAATETVTEATEIDEEAAPQRTATAPEVSLRPLRRPARPAPAPAPEPETEPEIARATPPAETPQPAPSQPQPAPEPEPQAEPEPSGPTGDAVMDALSQALDGGGGAPGLSQAQADGLRLRIEECWNVGLLSVDALQVVVTIGFEMTPDARPIESSIRMVAADGGTAIAQQQAYASGRQAIVQCGANGYGLPSALYDQWREVEITFNPARMSYR